MTYTRFQYRRDAGRCPFCGVWEEPSTLAALPVQLRAAVAWRIIGECDTLPCPPQRAFLGEAGRYPRLSAFTPRGLARFEWLARVMAALTADDDVVAVDVRGDRVDLYYTDEWQIVFAYREDFRGQHERRVVYPTSGHALPNEA